MKGELTGIDLRADEHKEVARLLQHHLPDTEVWAYGSRVQGAARPASDLDLVIFASAGQKEAVSRLREAFDESPLPFRVDLFVWDKVPEEFRKNIEEARVVVQEKKHSKNPPNNWKILTLSKIINLIGGGTPKRSKQAYWNGDIPWLSVKDFNNQYRYVDSAEETITELGEQESSTRVLKTGQLIISARGTVGALAQLTQPMTFNQSCYGIDAKREYTDNDFLYYLVKHSIDNLKQITHGAVFDTITRETFNHIEVSLPPPPQQKAIAHILGSLDDKIELNRRMNETLEAMAQALFKSWFVDFDPVIDNALAAGNAIPDELKEKAAIRQGPGDEQKSLPDDIRRLFPSEFAYTEEMGWIPKGWKTQSLYEIATFINGAAYKNFDFTDEPEALPIVKIAEIKNGISSQTKFTKTVLADKYRISDGDILFSWSGNPDTSIDTFIWTGGDAWLNQHIFKVLLKNNYEKSLVYYQLRILKRKFSEIARNKQTTGLGHVTAQDMKNMYVARRPSAILSLFNNSADLLLDRYYSNLMDIKNQSRIRDTLLYALLSGKVRIEKVEKFLEDKS